MGLATAQMRMIYLFISRLDLEYKITLITDAKMNLAQAVSDIVDVGTDLDADEPLVRKLNARKERLHVMEKQLDVQMAVYQGKLNMINTEMDSCGKLVDENIKRSFKY